VLRRPSLGAFFTALDGRKSTAVSTTAIDFSATAVAQAGRAIDEASVALVDASIDPSEALDVCRQLLTRRVDLRIGIIYCCPHAATAQSVRPFLEMGINSFLDLQLSADQTLIALRGIARGESVVHVQFSEDSSKALFNGGSRGEELSTEDLALLHLVALGSTDHEIGLQMCLSHHTIKHRIERLRRRVDARNRIQLAAYAGRLERSHGNGRS